MKKLIVCIIATLILLIFSGTGITNEVDYGTPYGEAYGEQYESYLDGMQGRYLVDDNGMVFESKDNVIILGD